MNEELRADFPLLSRRIEGKAVTYLDSAATSLKPRAVIDAITRYYAEQSANVHRGKHTLSEEASEAFEDARRVIASFLGASTREVALTSGTTHAINLVALGLPFVPGDNVVTSLQDHHSTLVPWFERAEVRVCPVGHEGLIDVDRLLSLMDGSTRLVAVGHASNATGAVQDVAAIVRGAQERGARVLLDGAQAAPHLPVDVKALGCDYYAFSGHKVLGPTGIGALYGTREALDALRPAQQGGGMVDLVTATGWTPKPVPFRFEAGTPNIAGAIGLAAALRYLKRAGWERIVEHERALAKALVAGVSELPGTKLLGPPPGSERLPLASLVIESERVAPDHIAMMLSDTHKIMARSGHHCCHPFFDGLGTTGALRLSAALYNTVEEIEVATAALRELLARLHAG